MIRARSRGIRTKAIWRGTLKDNEVGPAIYADYLPEALADGRYVPAPEPLIAGTGLENVQAAIRFRKQSPRSPQHLAVQGEIRI